MASETPFDLVIRGGTVATASERFAADVGVRGGVIAALAPALPAGRRELDARGCWVLPGGIDSHTHIEQRSAFGLMCADDFETAGTAAAFGGTTTTISFAAQHRGMAIPEVLADYHRRAAEKAIVDYAFHLIVANPDAATLSNDLPQAIAGGVRSFKLFTTYDRLRLMDEEILDVLAVARAHGALAMVHAENHGMIGWLGAKMVAAGNKLPRYHAICHARIAESEAIQRVVALAELVDTPILIVHVSTADGVAAVRSARARGLRVYAETCPQYLFLTADDLDRGGLDGAMFCCSPPPRDAAAQAACWQGLLDGTLALYSSDHAPFRFDASGKLPKGDQTTFKDIANGVPGIELRLPLLWSAGVATGRITVEQFVDLGATRHARLYGLYPRKGTLAIGADADIAVWDPRVQREVDAADLHDNTGYSPYQGRSITGWPTTVVSRGEVIVEGGRLHAARGRGRWLAREASDAMQPLGRQQPEMAQLAAWGTPLAPGPR